MRLTYVEGQHERGSCVVRWFEVQELAVSLNESTKFVSKLGDDARVRVGFELVDTEYSEVPLQEGEWGLTAK